MNRTKANSKTINEFENIYRSQFINYKTERYTPVGEDGELLIICHPDFIEAMEPFVA